MLETLESGPMFWEIMTNDRNSKVDQYQALGGSWELLRLNLSDADKPKVCNWVQTECNWVQTECKLSANWVQTQRKVQVQVQV